MRRSGRNFTRSSPSGIRPKASRPISIDRSASGGRSFSNDSIIFLLRTGSSTVPEGTGSRASRPRYFSVSFRSSPMRLRRSSGRGVTPAGSAGSSEKAAGARSRRQSAAAPSLVVVVMPVLLVAGHVDDHGAGQQEDVVLSGSDFDAIGVAPGEPPLGHVGD